MDQAALPSVSSDRAGCLSIGFLPTDEQRMARGDAKRIRGVLYLFSEATGGGVYWLSSLLRGDETG